MRPGPTVCCARSALARVVLPSPLPITPDASKGPRGTRPVRPLQSTDVVRPPAAGTVRLVSSESAGTVRVVCGLFNDRAEHAKGDAEAVQGLCLEFSSRWQGLLARLLTAGPAPVALSALLAQTVPAKQHGRALPVLTTLAEAGILGVVGDGRGGAAAADSDGDADPAPGAPFGSRAGRREDGGSASTQPKSRQHGASGKRGGARAAAGLHSGAAAKKARASRK